MINGNIIASGFISGANMLYNKRNEVDALNVFPVPDGDTGTNMSMTSTALAKALLELQTDSVTKVCDTMSYATLRGARGNSGVILSQYFRGISKSLKGKNSCTVLEFANALKAGSDAAYAAVMNPTEGTILTVGKAAALAAVEMAETEGAELRDVVEKALSEAESALARTPDMLPALKNAGVVDAGGQGWVYIIKGLLLALDGKPVEREGGEVEPSKTAAAQANVDVGDIKFGYCTEFIIEKSNPNVNVVSFRSSIEDKGDCMLVIDDDEIVKVHIHTNNPGFVLERAVKLGSLINIKIDNMRYQHSSIIDNAEEKEAPQERKKYGFVAVCAGDGLESILKDLGVDVVIKGGQTMNPSTEDILSAANSINAETVFIFPNNKNIIMAAEQASEICDNEALVIPTRSVPACIASMMRFKEDKPAEDNKTAMEKALGEIKTAQVTYAVRDTVADGKEISEGDIIGVGKGGIEAVANDKAKVVYDLLEGMYDDDNDEFITIYYGEDIDKETAEELAEEIEEKYPDAEVALYYGGQPIYYYIVSVE